MAQLKSTVVSGSLRVTDSLYTDTGQLRILHILTTSNGTTYGAGTNGQVVRSNGTSSYWGTLAKGDVGLGNVDNTADASKSVNYANSSGALTNFKVTTTTNLGIDAPGTNAIGYVSGLTKTGWNFQQSDGALYTQFYSTSWEHEIFGDYRTGQISVRGKNNGTWQAWRTILDSENYSYLAVPNTIFTTTGDLLYASSAATPARLAAGTAGYLLQTGGTSAAPSWIQATHQYVASTIVKRDSNGGVSLGGTTVNGGTLALLTVQTTSDTTKGKGVIEENANGTFSIMSYDTTVSGQDTRRLISIKNKTAQSDSNKALVYREAVNGSWLTDQFILHTGNYTDYAVSYLGNAGKTNMNDIARLRPSVGMTNLASTSNVDTPKNGDTYSSSWHLYWDACYSDDPSGSNAWVAQIVNKAGTNYWWVRSRKGHAIENGTAWDSAWRHLVTSTEAAVGGATQPVFINANGEAEACTAYGSASVNYATSAGKATNDGDGKVISSTYLKLSGGTVSGDLKITGLLTTCVGTSIAIPSTIVKGNTTSSNIGSNIVFLESTGTSDVHRTGRIYNYLDSSNIMHLKLTTYLNTANDTSNAYFDVAYDKTNDIKRTYTNAQIYGAVWNDYAEYRKTNQKVKPGQVVIDNDDGVLIISSKRLIPGAQVVSDTFGFAIGETKECKTPLAVAGRVLVYPHRNRYEYHAGMAVCSAPDGTVDIMTREEIKEYPDAIIGIVSEIPEYDEWGQDNVKVDGRIWIKIK